MFILHEKFENCRKRKEDRPLFHHLVLASVNIFFPDRERGREREEREKEEERVREREIGPERKGDFGPSHHDV